MATLNQNMFHIVSDIFLDFHEKAIDQHQIPSTTSYILITGNISLENKRSMLYAETLAKQYPHAKIIYNFGLAELIGKKFQGAVDGVYTKIRYLKNVPLNLYYPKGEVIGGYDFYSTIGWPVYSNIESFENSRLPKGTVIDYTEEFYIGDLCVTDKYQRSFDYQFSIDQANDEANLVKEWLKVDQGKQKILITGFGNCFSNYLIDSNYKVLPSLDLSNVIWVFGSDFRIMTKNQISVPGRDRTYCFSLVQ